MSKEAPKQYLFVSNRTIVVRSTSGASIGFERGKPTHVPRHMHQIVMEKGILPCDKDGKPIDLDAAPAVVEDKKVMVAPEDPIDRQKAIVRAIEVIRGRNDSRDFTSGGTPNEASVSRELGWRVDQKEVRQAWVKHRSNEAPE